MSSLVAAKELRVSQPHDSLKRSVKTMMCACQGSYIYIYVGIESMIEDDSNIFRQPNKCAGCKQHVKARQ